MIELIVKCTHCKRSQHYLSYNVKHREQVFGKTRICVWCGKRFTIKSEWHDNIIKEVQFR